MPSPLIPQGILCLTLSFCPAEPPLLSPPSHLSLFLDLAQGHLALCILLNNAQWEEKSDNLQTYADLFPFKQTVDIRARWILNSSSYSDKCVVFLGFSPPGLKISLVLFGDSVIS